MILLYSALLIGATFGWGYLFYKQDFHPQPIRKLLQMFFVGMFAVIPVFAYQHIYQTYLPMLGESEILRPLIQSPFLSGFFVFLLNLILLSIVLLSITAFLTLTVTFFKHETLENIRNTLRKDELEFVTVSVFIGLLVYIESILEKIIDIPIVQTIIGTILFLTIIEEYIKHLIVRFVDDKQIKDIDDAITFSVMVGLAFALIETFIYVLKGMPMNLVVYRGLLSIPVHVIASGIFGYYYGQARFARRILKHNHTEKVYHLALKWFHKVITLNRSTVYEEEKMIEGLALATLFHGSANILFELNLAFMVIPFIVFGLLLLSYFYKESHRFFRWLHG